jgi:hypothetical protein
MRSLLKPSSDDLRQSQRYRRAQFAPFCLPKKFCFYGFACLLLLRIKIRVARFQEEKRNGNKFSFAKRMSIYRVVASRCVAAINLNFTDL